MIATGRILRTLIKIEHGLVNFGNLRQHFYRESSHNLLVCNFRFDLNFLFQNDR